MWNRGVRCHHVESDILKEDPGAKNILGGWEIAEHLIPSIKVLFKTNTKSHDYPSIRPESKTQLVNQRKQKVAFNTGTAHSPEIQSCRMWWGAASPIQNHTPVVCIYTSYNRTHIKMHIYINTELLDGNKCHLHIIVWNNKWLMICLLWMLGHQFLWYSIWNRIFWYSGNYNWNVICKILGIFVNFVAVIDLPPDDTDRSPRSIFAKIYPAGFLLLPFPVTQLHTHTWLY